PPTRDLFPYTTLFRSSQQIGLFGGVVVGRLSPGDHIAQILPMLLELLDELADLIRSRYLWNHRDPCRLCLRSRVAKFTEVGVRRSEEHTSELQSRGHL